VVDEVHIQCYGLTFDQMELSIFHMNGKLLLKEDLLNLQQSINVSHFPVGTYSLQISNGTQVIHHEKILKR
jgi:hypothetical protein